MVNVHGHLKAIWSAAASGIIAFLSSLLTAVQGEHEGFDTITAGQWLTATLSLFVAVAGTGGVTYRVRNRPQGTPETVPSAPGSALAEPGAGGS